ncbi:MAG: S26 family signal peptidase [Planctomycetota bacterium]
MVKLQDRTIFGLRGDACVAIVLVLGPLIYLGFRLGADSRRQSRRMDGTKLRVRGDSMSPTLTDGQECVLKPIEDFATLRRGDLVAVTADGGLRVKRLAALPGDIVDAVDGRVTINGTRLETLLRARVSDYIAPALIPVDNQFSSWSRVVGFPDWLIYHHRDPHRGGRPGPVVDDYPGNVMVSRKLHPVDRLIVRFSRLRVDGTPPSNKSYRVAFHRTATESIQVAQASHEAGGYLVADSAEATVFAEHSLALGSHLDASRPVAIEDFAEVDSANIELLREIEYRDDRPGLDYPLTLDVDTFFVLGDNVPISVDSRATGPIRRNQIVGEITSPSFQDRP